MAKSLLVIDDSSTIREAVQLALAGAEWEFVTATSGAEAEVALREQRVDAILCDVAPGEEDGYELCRTLGASAEGAGVPALLMGNNVNATAALAVGASGTLPKPFTSEQLLQTLQETLEQSDFSFDFDDVPTPVADDAPLALEPMAEEFELQPAAPVGDALELEEIEVIDLGDDDEYADLELLDDLQPVEFPSAAEETAAEPADVALDLGGAAGGEDTAAGPEALDLNGLLGGDGAGPAADAPEPETEPATIPLAAAEEAEPLDLDDMLSGLNDSAAETGFADGEPTPTAAAPSEPDEMDLSEMMAGVPDAPAADTEVPAAEPAVTDLDEMMAGLGDLPGEGDGGGASDLPAPEPDGAAEPLIVELPAEPEAAAADPEPAVLDLDDMLTGAAAQTAEIPDDVPMELTPDSDPATAPGTAGTRTVDGLVLGGGDLEPEPLPLPPEAPAEGSSGEPGAEPAEGGTGDIPLQDFLDMEGTAPEAGSGEPEPEPVPPEERDAAPLGSAAAEPAEDEIPSPPGAPTEFELSLEERLPSAPAESDPAVAPQEGATGFQVSDTEGLPASALADTEDVAEPESGEPAPSPARDETSEPGTVPPPDNLDALAAAFDEPAVTADLATRIAAGAGQAVRESLQQSLSPEALAPLVAAAVERVAWEVVPQLAERLIRETIARLQEEPPPK